MIAMWSSLFIVPSSDLRRAVRSARHDLPVDFSDVGQSTPAQRDAYPSARSLLFTILADVVYRDPQPVWTASLLYVLKQAGFSEQASRQAIARGAAAGWM